MSPVKFITHVRLKSSLFLIFTIISQKEVLLFKYLYPVVSDNLKWIRASFVRQVSTRYESALFQK